MEVSIWLIIFRQMKVLFLAKSRNAYSFFAKWKYYFLAKWFRTMVRADARMDRISVFPIPGMATMGTELGPVGPKNKIQHLAVWRKMIRQMEISIWRILTRLAVWRKLIRQMEISI